MTPFKTYFMHFLREMLLKRNIYIARTTNNADLHHFFSMINPVSTDKQLIRIGDYADGGYLIPEDLEGIDTCFSPGVSIEASFEFELANRKIKSFLADYSVDSPPVSHELFDFEKKYLGVENNEIYMTLESWMNNKAPNCSESILQMDIEGAEYSVIYQTPIDVLKKFRIMVIEFHGLNNIFSPGGYDLIYLTFKKILSEYEIVHIHPNNVWAPISNGLYEVPPLIEFTFLRKNRIELMSPCRTFPNVLDIKNVETKPDFALPDCWRGTTDRIG